MSVPIVREYYDAAPTFPVKREYAFDEYDGPKYSIKLADLKQWLKDNRPDEQYYICADIIMHVIDIEYLLDRFSDDYGNYPVLGPDDDFDLTIITHVLEGIECFKYAVAQGCPVCYVISNGDSFRDYGDLLGFSNVMRLLFIDTPEVKDFFNYYIGLFPALKNDKDAIQYIIADTLYHMGKFEENGNEFFDFVVRTLQSNGISLDYEYYNAILYLFGNHSYTQAETLHAIQLGINNGFKFDLKFKLNKKDKYSEIIEFIYDEEIAGNLHLPLDIPRNLHFWRALPHDIFSNAAEWHDQERNDVVISNLAKTDIVIANRIDHCGDGIVNRNLAHLSGVITDFY